MAQAALCGADAIGGRTNGRNGTAVRNRPYRSFREQERIKN